jgi:hypothetical protein
MKSTEKISRADLGLASFYAVTEDGWWALENLREAIAGIQMLSCAATLSKGEMLSAKAVNALLEMFLVQCDATLLSGTYVTRG